ncbi:MAG TPA: hypothetical protein VHV29_11605 [Terriglobales bacterium]|jgi:hypothetical protein|nr:hypothetical protein [Terriglobales bacterium]
MPLIIFVMLFKAVFEGIHECVRKTSEAKPAPLCADCAFAHVQYGANARRAISCTYGGGVRPMKLDVLYCTDYRARDVPMRPGVIGFVYEIAPAE